MLRGSYLYLLVLALVLGSCTVQPVAAPAAGAEPVTVNLAATDQLYATTAIEILELAATQPTLYAYQQTVTDPATINQFVAALDTTLASESAGQCPAYYLLRFRQANGAAVEFGYACRQASPAFLRFATLLGDDLEVPAPDEFNQAFAALQRPAMQAMSPRLAPSMP